MKTNHIKEDMHDSAEMILASQTQLCSELIFINKTYMPNTTLLYNLYKRQR